MFPRNREIKNRTVYAIISQKFLFDQLGVTNCYELLIHFGLDNGEHHVKIKEEN